jgi:alginate O-acetyltransferase complex protein AlgJ
MPDTSLQRTREELARREVGHTKIGRWTAWVLAVQFVLVVAAVPVSEILHDRRYPEATDNLGSRLSRLVATVLSPTGTHDLEAAPMLSRFVSGNRTLIRELERFGDGAEDATILARHLRPPTQYLLAGVGAGNEQVYTGRRPWLFYRQGLDYLTGPGFLESKQLAHRGAPGDLGDTLQPDPRPAILQLKADLDERGIQLVVMPTPVKPTIHPEHFTGRFEGREDPLRPASYPTFIRELREHGVLVFDAAPALAEAKRRTGKSQYLMTDTHWRPEAMELVATHLEAFVTRHVDLAPTPPAGYVSQQLEVTNLGDVARMLDLPSEQFRYPAERVRLRQIQTVDHKLWQPSRSADVLLLGDSFSNVYSMAEMKWGESAGLAEQLSFLMQRPLDRIAQNADGAFATREVLGRELASGRDRLAGKRLVIFQFAERELAVGDWKLVDLSLGEAVAGRFFVPDEGDEVVVSGTIREIAPIPRPGTVPYADHIAAVHLVDLASEQPGVSGRQAVVYVWGMRNHILQEAARFRAGDRVTVLLRRWADVANLYDGINRTELETDDVQFEEPTWGEVIN